MEAMATTRGRWDSAQYCREVGLKVGDRLCGDEGDGITVIEITAIGEKNLLAKMVEHRGQRRLGEECLWTLSCRDWRKL